MEKLTDKTYWEGTYNQRRRQPSLNVDGFMNYSNRLILNKLLETNLDNKRVIEIGAGDSIWLPYLAKKFPSSRFGGMDYTESGCTLLAERARRENANIQIFQEDMFAENSHLHNTFDEIGRASCRERV